ncbi:MAG TPA: 30S ribosomal protein S1 [Humidesulfovibrio sp.]|uniref:30S ribosomal protein S1 n=1 Tax=Humidesulfovibrio sp. TaxID=2910988 RepID=UPI002C07845D|nr:30S ribosomal protein S1 [Humidesulfovibrio sp.]HWR05031.1 30S ribosomal protein S1 [Humidesulfovibrio sp.]
MTDQAQNTGDQEQSFAELFEASYAGQGEPLNMGDKISARIISIGAESVYFDTGTKVDGVADKKELLDAEGNFPHKEGDSIDLYVVSKTRSEIVLSRALAGAGGLEMLQSAKDAGLPVDGKVKETCKGGFSVEIMGRRAFCPVSQIDARFVENTEAYVGNTYPFLIAKLEERGRNIVVSRRALIERERQAATEEFLATIKPGEEIEGTVVRLTDFGAFVEIAPGLEGMVHVSELGFARIAKPEEAVSIGDKIRVKVLGVEPGKKPGQMKISLSRKQTMSDPWADIAGKLKDGEKVTGKVVRLADFGAFVELLPGVDGLIHVSEMSYTKRVNKPSEMLTAGDEVSVVIKEIDLLKRRISLSMKDAEGDPWLEAAAKYTPGTQVTGTVEKRETFGIFVTLEPGITALLPKSRMAVAVDPKQFDKLQRGDSVTLLVEDLRAGERRIALSPLEVRAGSQNEGGGGRENSDWKSYAKPAKTAEKPMGMGLLGEKLALALKSKK